MTYKELLQTIFPIGALQESPDERADRRVAWSRNAILNGWILSMIGMVAYCVAMLGDDRTSLFRHGLVGWAAVSFFLIGVGLWFTGSIIFLTEAERFSSETENEDDERGAEREMDI